ncbi:MAG: CoA transferase [Spirochaetales bacterium]|nr:CoA transferase [Spirochaetales bacterium]
MPNALEGITVIDLSHVLAGPFCTMILADLGAEVIKIEPPAGDDARRFGPFLSDDQHPQNRESAYFISVNRNKKSVCLDLKSESGRRVLEDLLVRADVVVENYRPTTMSKLGFSWQRIQQLNERIVYCSISGFGHDALPEFAEKPAYDMVAQAYSGLMSITGPIGGPPVRVGTSVGDIVAGHQAAIGILAALNYRHRSKKGQYIDISMVDGLVYILENAVVRYSVDGEIPQPLGTAHPSITPFQCFATKDGGWIVVPVGNDLLWRKFCEAIGRTDLTDHQAYKSNELRNENRSVLIPILEAEMRKKTRVQWLQLLEQAGLPNSPLNTIAEVVQDANIRYRQMIVDLHQPNLGTIAVAGSPFRMSETPAAIRSAAPRIGEHSRQVLRDFLGYPDREIERLLNEKALRCD